MNQGSTWTRKISLFTDCEKFVPLDLTDCIIRGQIRSTANSSVVIATFNVFINPDPTLGTAILNLTKVQTSAIPCDISVDALRSLTEYCYDIELEFSDGSVERIMQGVIGVSPEVTR